MTRGGVTFLATELIGARRLTLLKEAAPAISRGGRSWRASPGSIPCERSEWRAWRTRPGLGRKSATLRIEKYRRSQCRAKRHRNAKINGIMRFRMA